MSEPDSSSTDVHEQLAAELRAYNKTVFMLAHGLKQQQENVQAVMVLFQALEKRMEQQFAEVRRDLVAITPPPLAEGEYTLANGYQLLVDELAAVKRAVIALQKNSQRTATETPDVGPEINLNNRH